ncbi:hypothetical protein quinque_012561 [Culex quinquefasciatus]
MLASSSSKEDQSLEASHENVHYLLEEFSEKSVKFKVKLDITGKAKLYRANEQEKSELLPCLDNICKVLEALPDLKSEGKKDEH